MTVDKKKGYWVPITAITIVSGSLIGFSPIGVNLINFTASELKLKTESQDSDPAVLHEIGGLRSEIRSLAEAVDRSDNLNARQRSQSKVTESLKEPEQKTTSPPPLAMTMKLGGVVVTARGVERDQMRKIRAVPQAVTEGNAELLSRRSPLHR